MLYPTNEIQLYESLSVKIGRDEAAALIGLIDAKIHTHHEQNIKILATREDLTNTNLLLKDLELRVMAEMKTLFAHIDKKTSETARWMFGIFFAMMLAILGLYLKK